MSSSRLPLVTCLVTAYDVEAYLARALDSALAQDYAGEVEVLVVDDGSTDGTAEVLARYGDRIRVHRKENGGLISAVDAGIALARGEYIALLDGDDVWPLDRVRRQVELLEARPEVGLVHGDMEVIDADDRLVRPSFFEWQHLPVARGDVFAGLLRGNWISGGASMFRASLRDAYHPIPAGAAFPDWWLAVRIAEVAHVDHVDTPTNRYRLHGANMGLGAEGAKRCARLRDEIRFRRWMLVNLSGGRVAVADLAVCYGSLLEQVAEIAATEAVEPATTFAVGEADRAAAAAAFAEGAALAERGELDAAARRLLASLGHDPLNAQSAAAAQQVIVRLQSPPVPAPADASPLASIVIVAYGKAELTRRCLESLEAALGDELGRTWELVLVDNASPDDGETAELLRSWQDRATVLLLPENLNYSGGNNVGAQAARGEVVVFLNNDTEVPQGSLEPLVEQAREQGVGAVGVRLLYPDGTIQHGGVAWRRDQRGILHAFHLFLNEPGDLAAANAVYDLDVVTGACLAMRRDLFLELGGFDDAYVNGYEDVDLCLKTRTAGHRVVYRGDSFVWHNESATRGRNWDMTDNDRILRSRWEALLDEDNPLVAELFGARLDRDRSTWHPGYLAGAHRISVEGHLSGPSDEAGASRLLLAALEGAGLEPAGRDWYEVYVLARLHEEEERLLKWARARPLRPDALRVLYVAREPRNVPAGVAVWAATRALGDRLGVPYVPPPALPLWAGPGGDGVLVVAGPRELPGALERARGFGGRIRIVPTVATPEVRALAGVHDLLPPIASDLEFAALAMTADAVVCADGDPFQRRALVAASMGALPVVEGDGPARELLGDLARVGRAERAARVQAACGFEALAPRLRDLLDPPVRVLKKAA